VTLLLVGNDTVPNLVVWQRCALNCASYDVVIELKKWKATAVTVNFDSFAYYLVM